MEDLIKHYSNGEITIVWKPSLCIHSTYCWRGEKGLPLVFNPRDRPWIKPDGAESDTIIEHIRQCPSGALGYFRNGDPQAEAVNEANEEIIIEPVLNGPLLVYGNISVKDKAGSTVRKTKVTAFCRCGASANKPYCDGAHTRSGFTG